MLVSLTVGKVDAGVTVLLTPDKRLIEFPSILLPPDITSGSIVDITVSRNLASESAADSSFRALQDAIYNSFGSASPATPQLRCRNATQTSVVLEWDPIDLATADLLGLALYRNGQKAGSIPRPLQMHSTKISGLAVDTEYTFHLVLRTSAGTFASEKVKVRTHKMTDLSGVTITTGILPPAARESLAAAVERIGARLVDGVRIDTTHFVTTEGRGIQWEKAVEMNIPVVRPEWVEACEKNGRILGVTKFYLDALRPGPPSPNPGAQGQPAQAAPLQRQPSAAKELPTPPNASSEAEEAPTKPKERDEAVSGDEGEEEDEAGGSAENKVRSPAGDEQKVRFDDKEKENLAHRPKPTVEDEDDDADGRDGKEPDGASFQDVQL